MDKLISAAKAKEEIRNYIEDPSMLTLLDNIIDYRVPSVDPMAKGQWLNYKMITKILRGLAEQKRTEAHNLAGAIALEEAVDYFDKISCMIGGKDE